MKFKSSDPTSIAEMFSDIAKKYDRTNLLMSFGLNILWNRKLTCTLKNRRNLLDLCAGIGVVAFRYLHENPNGRATLLDFSLEMLEVAKLRGREYEDRFQIIHASAENIPFPNNAFDSASIAYGIRNIANLPLAFSEAYRVLAPGGRLSIFEMTRPTNALLKSLHRLYLKKGLPLLAKIGSGKKDAYEYLSESILNFLPPSEIESHLRNAGFTRISRSSLLGGTATIITADKC